MKTYTVGIIIVLYYPNNKHIIKLIEQIYNKDCYIFIIDNTPQYINSEIERFARKYEQNVSYLPQFTNKGIAEAQNIGINQAKKLRSVTHVAFLDQDSMVEKDFVRKMLDEYIRIESLGIQISALGPTPINAADQKKYKQEPAHKNKRGSDYYLPSKIISSGMLISIKTIFEIGLMESSLFIDVVDFEWCWRAKSKGYQCCITDSVEITQKVGVQNKTFLRYPIIVSSPMRYYYQYRNFIKLFSRPYVPLEWKIKNAIKKIFFLVFIPLCTRNGKESLKKVLRGIKEGFKDVRNEKIHPGKISP